MSTQLRVDTERRADGGVVLHAVGEIDASNAGVFAEALSAAAVSSDSVTVDLSAVQYLDSAAINVLVSHGGPLHIVANPMLIPVLRISGVAELATVRAAPRGET